MKNLFIISLLILSINCFSQFKKPNPSELFEKHRITINLNGAPSGGWSSNVKDKDSALSGIGYLITP